MYRKNQFTVYKQLTRIMKEMIYCTGWRPTVQSSWTSYIVYYQKSNKAVYQVECVLSGIQLLCKAVVTEYSVQTQVHKIYWENRFSHVKQKQARKATIAQLIIIPYLVWKTYIYSSGHDSSVGIASWLCYSSDFELHHIFSLHCRLPTQAYEQQANGEKDQQVSMSFIQPSGFSLHNQPFSLQKTENINPFKFFKLVSFYESARWYN